MLDLSRPVQTRAGQPARILATDIRHTMFPIAAAITMPDGSEIVVQRALTGCSGAIRCTQHRGDLVNVPTQETA